MAFAPQNTNPLRAPIDGPGRRLLEVIFDPMYGPRKTWPVWDHVEREIYRTTRLEPELILGDLPRVRDATSALPHSYGLVWRSDPSVPHPRREEFVGLTVAGLAALGSAASLSMAQQLVALTCGLAMREREARSPNADEVSDDTFSITADLQNFHVDGVIPDVPTEMILDVLEREPWLTRPWAQDGWRIRVPPRLRRLIGVGSVEDYLDRTVTELQSVDRTPPRGRAAPLALPQTLEHLALVCAMDGRLRLRGLLGRAQPSSYAGLAVDAETREEYLHRVAMLYDVLDKLNVPKLTEAQLSDLGETAQPKSIRRFGLTLEDRLGAESGPVIGEAVLTLKAVLDLRGAGVHSDAAPKVLEASNRLGLPFPVTDWSAAWDQIRYEVTWALELIRTEIQAGAASMQE